MVKATVNPSFYPVKEILRHCRRAYGPSGLNFRLIPEKAIKFAIIKRMCHLNLDPSVKRAQFFYIPRTQQSLCRTDMFTSVKEPVTAVVFLPGKNCLMEAWIAALHLPIFFYELSLLNPVLRIWIRGKNIIWNCSIDWFKEIVYGSNGLYTSLFTVKLFSRTRCNSRNFLFLILKYRTV